jgi:hypothetical protein
MPETTAIACAGSGAETASCTDPGSAAAVSREARSAFMPQEPLMTWTAPGIAHEEAGAAEHRIVESAHAPHEHTDANAGPAVTASTSATVVAIAAKRLKGPPARPFGTAGNKRRARPFR